MFRDIVSNKWVIGGVAFLIVFAVACVFWYRYDTAPDRRDAAETTEAVREWEATQKANTNNVTEDETNTLAGDNALTADKPMEIPSEENTSPVNVSPYGFGPYPEIPPDFPANRMPPWTWSDEKRQKLIEFSKVPNILRDGELIYRVYIKMWNEGMRILPAAKVDPDTDRVYLEYPNTVTVYVTYGYTENPDGTRERIINGTKAYGVKVGVDITEEDILNGNIPDHITVKSSDENEGVDPYSYLGLKR